MARVLILIVGAALVGAIAAETGSAGSAVAAPPKLVQFSYDESNDGSSRRYNLAAYSKRTEALRFSVRFDGNRLSTGSRYNPSITDTDLSGESSHPWQIKRDTAGRQILRKVRRSLANRGWIKIRIRAVGPGGSDIAKHRLKLSSCHQEPPLYPVSCEADL